MTLGKSIVFSLSGLTYKLESLISASPTELLKGTNDNMNSLWAEKHYSNLFLMECDQKDKSKPTETSKIFQRRIPAKVNVRLTAIMINLTWIKNNGH